MNRYLVLYKLRLAIYDNVFGDDEVLVLDTEENRLLLLEGNQLSSNNVINMSYGAIYYIKDGIYCCNEFGIYARGYDFVIAFVGKIWSMRVIPNVIIGYEIDSNTLFLTDLYNTRNYLSIHKSGKFGGKLRNMKTFEHAVVGEYEGDAGIALTRYLV